MPECPRCDTPIVFEGLEGKCPNIPNPLDVEGLWQGTSGLIKDSEKPKILVKYKKMRQENLNRNCRHRQFPVREVADNNFHIYKYKYKCLECDYYLSLKEFQKGSLGSRNAIMFCGICGRNWHIPCPYSEEDEGELGMELDRLLDATNTQGNAGRS